MPRPARARSPPVGLLRLLPCCLRLASLRMSMIKVANSRALNRANFCRPCKAEKERSARGLLWLAHGLKYSSKAGPCHPICSQLKTPQPCVIRLVSSVAVPGQQMHKSPRGTPRRRLQYPPVLKNSFIPFPKSQSQSDPKGGLRRVGFKLRKGRGPRKETTQASCPSLLTWFRVAEYSGLTGRKGTALRSVTRVLWFWVASHTVGEGQGADHPL